MKTEFRRVADLRLSSLRMPLSLVLRILMRTAGRPSAPGPNLAGKVVFR